MRDSWNWDIHNTVVYSWWRTETALGLLCACAVVATLSLAYEALASLRVLGEQDAAVNELSYAGTSPRPDNAPFRVPGRWRHSVLYGLQSLLAIHLMLVMMTFNGYLILSIVVGAAAGHYVLGGAAGGCR